MLENANLLYAALFNQSIFVENIADFWNDENRVDFGKCSLDLPWHVLSDADLYTGFQSILSLFELPSVAPSSSTTAAPSSCFSVSLFLSQYDRRCYSVYHRCLPLYYYLQFLLPRHPELTSFAQQVTRLVVVMLVSDFHE